MTTLTEIILYADIALVKIAVQKGIITKDNYKEITGFVYPATK